MIKDLEKEFDEITEKHTDFYVKIVTEGVIGNFEWIIVGDGEPLYELELYDVLFRLNYVNGDPIISKEVGVFNDPWTDGCYDRAKFWRTHPMKIKRTIDEEELPLSFVAWGRHIPKAMV